MVVPTELFLKFVSGDISKGIHDGVYRNLSRYFRGIPSKRDRAGALAHDGSETLTANYVQAKSTPEAVKLPRLLTLMDRRTVWPSLATHLGAPRHPTFRSLDLTAKSGRWLTFTPAFARIIAYACR